MAERVVEEAGLLRHDADGSAEALQVEVADVDAVDGDAATLDVVEAEEQAEERRFSAAGRAHEGDRRARRHFERNALQDRLAVLLVREVHVLERHLGSRETRARVFAAKNESDSQKREAETRSSKTRARALFLLVFFRKKKE